MINIRNTEKTKRFNSKKFLNIQKIVYNLVYRLGCVQIKFSDMPRLFCGGFLMDKLLRIAVGVPKLKVANPIYNTMEIIKILEEACDNKVDVISFPELSITSCSCGDLFFQKTLLDSSLNSLSEITTFSKDKNIFIVVGAPLLIEGNIYNCAVIINDGSIIGVVPKNDDKITFTSYEKCDIKEITLLNFHTPFGTDLVFTSNKFDDLKIAVVIGEDYFLNKKDANVIINITAKPSVADNLYFEKNLTESFSKKLILTYSHVCAGVCESTTDSVFDGNSFIFENGILLDEIKGFSLDNELIFKDTDIESLNLLRRKNKFGTGNFKSRLIPFFTKTEKNDIRREISSAPYLMHKNMYDYLENIWNIQIFGLIKRLNHINCKHAVLGISGGLDSTLALIVTVKAFDLLQISRKNIVGVTMPCFGTSNKTYKNALALMDELNITKTEISIKDSVLQHFKDIKQDPDNYDITFENAQARERTQILMDLANKINGIAVGTGDLSEIALGWCTYNGDHMSMYSVNSGVLKSLIAPLLSHYIESQSRNEVLNNILRDVIDTPVSPELLPLDKSGESVQKTENSTGPYGLVDFFIYQVVLYGFAPKKIVSMAEIAFKDKYDRNFIIKYLKVFYKRFFNSQFKRSCSPDGVSVGLISLSPRVGLSMASDSSYEIWLNEVENL